VISLARWTEDCRRPEGQPPCVTRDLHWNVSSAQNSGDADAKALLTTTTYMKTAAAEEDSTPDDDGKEEAEEEAEKEIYVST
jgi:hypothetical protein